MAADFLNISYHTSVQDSKVSGASIASPGNFALPPCCCCRLWEVKSYGDEVFSNAILFIPSSVSGGHPISKYNREKRAHKKVVKFLKTKNISKISLLRIKKWTFDKDVRLMAREASE